MSNKGILENLNNPSASLWKQAYSNTPKTTCVVIVAPETILTDSHTDNLSEELKETIKTLKLNYIKWVYDYAAMGAQVAKIVKWFPNINEVMFNLNDIPTACINNIIHHFDEIVKENLQLK